MKATDHPLHNKPDCTGTWELRFSQVGPVTYKLKVKPAKRFVALEAIDLAGPAGP